MRERHQPRHRLTPTYEGPYKVIEDGRNLLPND
jgi:hypothetical protein